MKKCTRVFDGEGRFSPEFDACTLEIFDADLIILSVGQAPTADRIEIGGESVKLDRGLVQADPVTLETSVAGVFAGGDGVTGPRSTIEAINQGHEAALSIDRYLTRKDLREGREKPEREPAPVPPDRLFHKQPREKVEELAADERRGNFREIETTITEEQALREAQRCLNCGLCCECKQCVEACGVHAIDHDMTDRIVSLDVGSVILAPGFDLFDSQLRGEYGYGVYKNVITSMEFERILSSSGPFGGHVVRPSDHEEPKKMGWIQCVGSRDVTCGRGYCSSVCCMYAIKEAIMAIDHVPGLEATIFYNDMRTYGKGYEFYYESARNKFGVKFNRGIVSFVKELQQSKNLLVRFLGEDGKIQETEFDMLVLSTGIVPCEGTRQLAERVGIELNEFGFCKTELLHPGETSRKGVYVSGVFESPKDIPETVASSCSAAGLAAMNLSEARGTLVKEKEYPPERDVSSEELRIGVFVCHCGTNIGGVVDVPRAAEYAKTLPSVVHAQRFTYTCSSDSQVKIVEAIKEHRLNRVVVASCTPRTHEPLFQDCLREAGLNKYLFEMANIREQCSWVHKPDVEKANLKSHDLIRMAVARVARLEQLKDFTVSVNQKALVIGGGVAGMNAALNLASQGFQTTIVEKTESLGGNMARVRYLLDGSDPQAYVRDLIEAVENNHKIKVYTGSRVIEFSGHKGSMKSVIASNGTRITVDHGIVVVATGGVEYRPQEYLYGESDRIMTQLEFESLMADREKDAAAARSVVMIQCVGSRDKEHPFPETEVTILYRDIRTYGLFETWYKEARDLGVLFVRYEEDEKPGVTLEGGKPVVTARDTATGFNLKFEPDYLVLSAGIRPNPDNDAVGAMLKVPRNPDGFFLEAHMKLRPLDFTTEGAYLCGLAHSPKNVSDSIVQARGAAARAAIVLSRDTMVVAGTVSTVQADQCVACLTCVRTCPYGAPHINEQGVAEIEVAACQGCGNCAAACPRKAIIVGHYKDDQITSKLEGLFADLEAPVPMEKR
jgi:heterodisulfide reductase subunit A-like polyferredoxin